MTGTAPAAHRRALPARHVVSILLLVVVASWISLSVPGAAQSGIDNNILWDALFSDSTELFCYPLEASSSDWVAVQLRTAAGDVEHAYLHAEGYANPVEMIRVADNDEVFDYYVAQLPPTSGTLRYYFEVRDGTAVAYVSRFGVHGSVPPANDQFVLPRDFETPDWAKGAVIYQIFPDRFYNGDPSNDIVSKEYVYDGAPVVEVDDWNAYPASSPYPAGSYDNRTREFYGGDLEGIIQKLDYLADLGVEGIYLNPVFLSPSNHKYDTQDYLHVDPHLGTIVNDGGAPLTDEEIAAGETISSKYLARVTDPANLEASDAKLVELINAAHSRGIRVILDGVFNHCGSWHYWMDTQHIYPDSPSEPGFIGGPGAYEEDASPFHDYFKWLGGTWPNNPEYEAWYGFRTLPKLNYEASSELQSTIYSAARHWIQQGADGWRLDVAAELGHSEWYNHLFWQGFRSEVRSANPESLIVAEFYGDPTAWLAPGNQWDSVMNYDAFMDPVSFFLTGMEKHSYRFDSSWYNNVRLFNDYIRGNTCRMPGQSLMVAMNQLSNHDHSRFMTRTNHVPGSIDGGEGYPERTYEEAGQGLRPGEYREAAIVQFTWPGMPTIYYGDEVGMVGWTDPDDRRTFPWDDLSNPWRQELLAFHRELVSLRKTYSALRTGATKTLLIDDARDVYAFGRFDNAAQIAVVINNSDTEQEVGIPVWQMGVPDGAQVSTVFWADRTAHATTGPSYTVSGGSITAAVPSKGGVVLATDAAPDVPLPQPGQDPTTTVIRVHYDTGFGNSIYIRGNAGGLSGAEGTAAQWTTGNVWELRLTVPAGQEFSFWPLVNDYPDLPAAGAPFTGHGGEVIDVYPNFHPQDPNTTVIRVHYDVGYGHKITIRGDDGDGPLDWSSGQDATWTRGNVWTWKTSGIPDRRVFQFKVLIDDSTWSDDPNFVAPGGSVIDVWPSFGTGGQRRETTFRVVYNAPDGSMMTVRGGDVNGSPVGRFSWQDGVPLTEVSPGLWALTTGTDEIPLNTWLYWKPLLNDEDWARATNYVLRGGMTVEIDPDINDRPVATFSWTITNPNAGRNVEVRFLDESTDGDGLDDITSWSWTFGDGTSSSERNPTHTYARSGWYNVTLTVRDTMGATSTLARHIKAGNLPPTARFSFTPEQPTTADEVSFKDESTDPEDAGEASDIVAWAWEFGDGATSSEQHPVHRYTRADTYTATLTVTDSAGNQHTAFREITVGNGKPTAAFTFTPSAPTVEDTVRFVDESTDPDGPDDVISWAWAFGDGTTSDERNPQHRYAANGAYDVSLTVTDSAGHQDTATKRVVVGNAAPRAEFVFAPSSPSVEDAVKFLDQSTDPDGPDDIKSWNWSFGDGATSTERHPSHKYQAKGTYQVTLVVRDSVGNEGSITKDLQVVNSPPQVSVLSPEAGAVWTGVQHVRWKAEDPDGEDLRITLEYRREGDDVWRLIARDEADDGDYAWDTSKLERGGRYRVRVTATDPDGATGTAESAEFTIAVVTGAVACGPNPARDHVTFYFNLDSLVGATGGGMGSAVGDRTAGSPERDAGRQADGMAGRSAALYIYDIAGRLVYSADIPAGTTSHEWSLVDGRGAPLARGLYIYALVSDDGKVLATGRIVIVR